MREAQNQSLWSERKTYYPSGGGGSCYEAGTQIVMFGNHRGFSPVRMSNYYCARSPEVGVSASDHQNFGR
ncbi:hypothetical protein [Nostoc sp.]|uniref:hypothetical protein n=1 Tax=Nostoc sp. TaxID=1180 RepID=UPI002FF97605